jgi:microcystin-dependent protein
MDPFLGEIRMFGGNFAPQGRATCDGQILPIAQNTALFSLLGTTYGGNGQTTFALRAGACPCTSAAVSPLVRPAAARPSH